MSLGEAFRLYRALIPACKMLVKPSTYCSSMSRRASTKPIKYIETAMELANVNIKPMAPPNSGPKRK